MFFIYAIIDALLTAIVTVIRDVILSWLVLLITAFIMWIISFFS